MVSYGESVKKPFTDLKKLLIGIVLSIIPIVNFTVVQGFAMESSGVGKAKPSKSMPEWKEWRQLFVKGLTAAVIKIIYMLPALVVIAVAVGLAIGDIASALLGTVVTPDLMKQIKAGETTPEQVQMLFRENWYLILPTVMKLAPIFLVGLLLLLIAAFLTPMAVLNYLKKRKFSAAFELSTVARKALTGKYILTWLVVIVLAIVLGVILSLIPLLGPAILLFLISVISYSLFGQAYREA